MEDYTDEEDMEEVKLDDDMERHWRIVFEYNDGVVDDNRSLIHSNSWDFYINER